MPTPAPSGTGNLPKSPGQAAAANPAEALATAAYARLAAQDKRGAATLFDAALAADAQAQAPDSRAKDWAAARKALGRRWSGEAYALLRNAGTTPLGAAASPVLGGSQSGGNLAYTFNPLDRRPIAITARLNAATDAAGRTDPRTAQAAIGVRWQALRQLSISAERLVSAGELARDDWTLRLAAGSDGALPGPLKARYSAYGEAGAIANGDLFIGAQGKALVPLLNWGPASISAGPGVWGSLQQAGGQSVGRLDLGPSASVRLTKGRLALEISADYRQRIAGKAEPGSGPALTLSTGF